MTGILRGLAQFGLDLVFPRACVGCGTEGSWLCARCAARLDRLTTLTCLACGRRRPDGRTCDRCRTKVQLTGTVAALNYDDPLARELVHELKYRGIRDLAAVLGGMLAETTRQLAPSITEGAAIVPVPLHPSRERERGFNQAALIAGTVSRTLSVPLIEVLKRTRRTQPQIELADPKLRSENVAGAFALARSHPALPKRILLTDDVATTGATLSECAHVLRQAGVREVWGVVVAR